MIAPSSTPDPENTVRMSEVLQALTAAGWVSGSRVDEQNLRIDFTKEGHSKALLLKSLLDEVGYPPSRPHMECLHAVLKIAASPA